MIVVEGDLSENESVAMKVDRLVTLAASGDAEAGNQLLQLYRQRLRSLLAIRMDPRLTARLDPSDVVQGTLALAHQRLPDYLREQRIPFYPWLRQIALNQLIDLHRRHFMAQKRSLNKEVNLEINDNSALLLVERLVSHQASPSQQLLHKEMKQIALNALQTLPDETREIIVMRHLEGLSVKEIAVILEMEIGTVKSRHFRGLQALRRIIDE